MEFEHDRPMGGIPRVTFRSSHPLGRFIRIDDRGNETVMQKLRLIGVPAETSEKLADGDPDAILKYFSPVYGATNMYSVRTTKDMENQPSGEYFNVAQPKRTHGERIILERVIEVIPAPLVPESSSE